MTMPGYEIDRDGFGLTLRERHVVGLHVAGMNQVEIAAVLGIKKQRVGQLLKAIEGKGVKVVRGRTRIVVSLPSA